VRTCGRIGLFVAAMLVSAWPVLAAEIDKDFHQSFEVRPGQRLVLRHGDGDVTVTPTDGDVHIEQLQGEVFVGVQDGEISVVNCQSERCRIRSEDGDIDLQLLQSDDLEAEIVSAGGDFAIALAAGTPLTFSLESDDGDIRLGLPGAEILQQDETSLKGRLEGGQGRRRIQTDDGGIRLHEMP